MKTENLTKVLHDAQSLAEDIRAAHKDAIDADNKFAEIAIYDLIETAAKLEQKLNRLMAAANDR